MVLGQGAADTIFLERLIAFQIGGIGAIAAEFIVLPVRARTRLVESLATSVSLVTEMEACIAHGIEEGKNVAEFPKEVDVRLEDASRRAKVALTAAEVFCKLNWHYIMSVWALIFPVPFCSKEPRLKGSFDGLAVIYTEVRYSQRHFQHVSTKPRCSLYSVK